MTTHNTLTLNKKGERILAYAVALTPTKKDAIMRAAGRNQYNVANVLI
jgi:hypothetical protein